VLLRNAHGAALIGFDLTAADTERFGEIVHGECKRAALPSDPPADMLIDWRHEVVLVRPDIIIFTLLAR
jgi:hypothetical protein